MENKFCSNCGSGISEGVTFCEKCGKPVENKESTEQNNNQNNYQVNQQQSINQPRYSTQPNYQQQYGYNDIEKPMSVGQYIGTMLLLAIPIAGFVLYIVWAFSSDININKKNYCRAVLILQLIVLGIYILFFVVILGAVASSSRMY